MALRPNIPIDAAPFRLSDIPCSMTMLLTGDGRQHLLFRDGGRSLQIVIDGASVFEPVHLVTAAVLYPDAVRPHLVALACLNELCISGRLPALYFPVEPRCARLRTVLQALDASLAGASYREIAVALFGRNRADTDWTDPRGHLRDQVRRAARRGRALMNGSYRQFLR